MRPATPDLFSAAAAPTQVRIPPRPPMPAAPAPPAATTLGAGRATAIPRPGATRLGACLHAHTALQHAHDLAQQLEALLRRAPASPNPHAASFAGHAAVQIGGAVRALASALLLNGADAHDALTPAYDAA